MSALHKAHFYVLLDRSGSMESMREAVVAGFNRLLADQKELGPDALFTLVQFDSQDPHEVLAAAVPITRLAPLSASQFVPRGGTPLLDATGRVVTMAGVRADALRADATPAEDITIVTITDGQENQSHEFTRREIVELIKDKEAAGWAFVFLGAGVDAYAEAGGIGYDARSVQAWAPDGAGAAAAFGSLSRAMSAKRASLAGAAPIDKRDFFRGDKEAEADAERRHRR